MGGELLSACWLNQKELLSYIDSDALFFLISFSVPSLLSLGHTLMEPLERQCLDHSELMAIQGRVATELHPRVSLSLGVNNLCPKQGIVVELLVPVTKKCKNELRKHRIRVSKM